VGGVGNTGGIPIAQFLQTIMEPDAQWNAGQAMNGSGKNPQSTEHMVMDKLGLCRVFRFLTKLFHSKGDFTQSLMEEANRGDVSLIGLGDMYNSGNLFSNR